MKGRSQKSGGLEKNHKQKTGLAPVVAYLFLVELLSGLQHTALLVPSGIGNNKHGKYLTIGMGHGIRSNRLCFLRVRKKTKGGNTTDFRSFSINLSVLCIKYLHPGRAWICLSSIALFCKNVNWKCILILRIKIVCCIWVVMMKADCTFLFIGIFLIIQACSSPDRKALFVWIKDQLEVGYLSLNRAIYQLLAVRR